MKAPLIALATGGTGGHVFPAEALAAELTARGYRLALITDPRGGALGGRLGELETHFIYAGGLAGKRVLTRIGSVFALTLGTLQAYRILTRLNPAAVIGFGGYASVPTILAAGFGGYHTALHEQNAVFGRANRLLAKRVERIATSFKHHKNIPNGIKARTTHTGIPVRPAFIKAREKPYEAPIEDGPIRLLVLGGSQGAHVFSKIIPAALGKLPPKIKSRILLTQQCRPEDLNTTKAACASEGLQAHLEVFFDDIPKRLAACHLLISRAGASTLGETIMVGRPSILVPYPYAIDNHQTRNAHVVDEVGAGWLIPQDMFTEDVLSQRFNELFSMPVPLEMAAVCARTMGRPDAVVRLADLVAELISENNSNKTPINGTIVL